MTVHHLTGFEVNSLATADAVVTSGGTVSLSTGLSGSFALRVNPTTTAVGWAELGRWSTTSGFLTATATGTSPFVCGFKFLPVTAPAATSEQIASFHTSTGTLLAALRLTSAGELAIYNNDGSTQVGISAASVVLAATRYYIEWTISHGTAGACVASVRVNGTQVLSVTTGTFTTAAADLDVCRLGKVTNRNGNSVDLYYDDAYIGDAFLCAATNTEGEWPQVARLQPNANGTYAQWTAGTGASDYTQVDEVTPDGDASMVQSTAASDVSTFNVTDSASAGVSGIVHAVVAAIRAKRFAAGGSWLVRMRSGTTEVAPTTVNSASGYSTTGVIQNVDPNTAAAWTTAGVDGVQVGANEHSTSTARVIMSWAAVMALFSPAAAGGGGQPPRTMHQTRMRIAA